MLKCETARLQSSSVASLVIFPPNEDQRHLHLLALCQALVLSFLSYIVKAIVSIKWTDGGI